ncbi:MAG TPA: hypothetical protein ENN34_13965 [Deltaproteobacteria bacterium]|nr:hypothetical protein [Deltaproteobacteria bacterium]
MNFKTSGYGGRTVREVVRIITNDFTQPGLSVAIAGHVEKFAEISPERARLMGKVGESISTQITITPRKDYPFRITHTTAESDEHFTFILEERNEEDHVTYVLRLVNTKDDPGMYAGRIILETDSPVKPKIMINVLGRVTPR